MKPTLKDMRKTLLLFFIILGFSVQGKCSRCDTIDTYWVYYNDSVWAKLNQYTYGYQLKLDKSKIKKNDSISIEYNTDTPCYDCWNYIQVKDEKYILLKENKSLGTGSRISFSVKELLELSNKHQIKNLYFYYNFSKKRLLIQLKLE